MPIHIWATEAAFSPEQEPVGEAEPEMLARGMQLLATALEKGGVAVILPDGRRGNVPFCLTDFGLLASQNRSVARALPAPVRLLAAGKFLDCLGEFSRDATWGMVLQGPTPLWSSPDLPPGPDAPKVESFQMLRIEAEPGLPSSWVKVQAGAGLSGLLPRQRLAVGGEPGWTTHPSPKGLHIANRFATDPVTYDFWMIPLTLDRFVPVVVGALIDDKSWQDGWSHPPRELENIAWEPPVEWFGWEEDAIWRQSEGVWMPLADPAPTCDRLPTRLHVERGSVRLVRGTAKNLRWTITEMTRHQNASATLSARENGGKPVLVLFWVGAREGERAVRWLVEPDEAHPAPGNWVRLNEKEAERREQEVRAALGCTP